MKSKSAALIIMFFIAMAFLANVAVSPVAAIPVATLKPTSGTVGTSVTVTGTIDTIGGGFRVYFDTDNDGNPTEKGELMVTGTSGATGQMSTYFVVPDCSGSRLGIAHKIRLQDITTSNFADYSFYVTLTTNDPNAVFGFAPQSPEYGKPVTFDATNSSDSDGEITSYSWDFDDGNTTSVATATVTHTYTTAGSYEVRLTVTDNDGLTDTTTQTVVVIATGVELIPPVASFTFSPSSPEVNQEITFNSLGSSDSDGEIVEYLWEWDDGTTLTDPTVYCSVSEAGTYTMKLTVTDNDGLNGTTTKTITVSPADEYPEASFTFSPTSPEEGQTVTFDALGSSDSDGQIENYSWDFDDGNTTSVATATVTHTYTTAGSYNVVLTVTDDDGFTGTESKAITVRLQGSEVDDEPPVANAGSNMAVSAGSKVTFSAASSTDNVGITSYEWDFGDDNSATGETVSHTYGAVGNYTVTLTVRDAAGNSDTATILITVKEAEAGFPYWIILVIVLIVVAAVVIWYFLKKRKPKEEVPEPARIKLTVEPTEILADGKSTSTITIELLDYEGKPVAALADTEISVVSSMGKLTKPIVKIAKGKGTEKTGLVASKEAGTATVSADAKDLDRAVVAVVFLEKKRYCMHCGSKMAFTAKRCPVCGKSPPAGVDTKTCKNCGAVIPAVANFCAECGASQPRED